MDEYKSFAAIIYVTDNDAEAVNSMYRWQPFFMPGDKQEYFGVQHQKGQIISAKQDEPGLAASASLAMKLIERFRPKYIIMPGVAAGIQNDANREQMFGDIVLAENVWNYSNGRFVPKDEKTVSFGEVGFLSAPTVINVDESVIPYFEKTMASPKNEVFVHIGAIASGSAAFVEKNVADERIKSEFITTKCIDTESYGVAYAAEHASEPRPKTVIAKSVCDFTAGEKSGTYEKLSSFTSCAFVKIMIEDVLD